MIVSKRAALAIALVVIALSWVYQILRQQAGDSLPGNFTDFALRVAMTKFIVIAVVFVLLRLGDSGFREFGVRRRHWRRRLGVGLAIGLAMFIVFNVALGTVMGSLFPRAPDNGPSVMSYFTQPANLLLWLPISIFAGGVVEELQRIFIVTRFEHWLGRAGLIIGIVLSSAMFGYGHLYQGLGVAISTAISGAALALLYLRRRSALEPIAAHAISDVLAVLAATMLVHPHG